MYFQWKPYVSVAERRKKAERIAARLRKKGKALSPVTGGRGAIARTFWGRAWCDNLERYSDFANRLPRGRTYLRNGSVIDLKIAAGMVSAQVMGSDLYQVAVNITAVPKAHWHALGSDCAGSIDSLVELLQGRLSKGVMERICRPQTGLFPAPKEITFNCSCPDWASMCKHVAAVFYGVGARLDEQPELLFTLRRVEATDLVARAGSGLPLAKKEPAAGRVLEDSQLAEVFGIEMAEAAATVVAVPPARVGKSVAREPAPKKVPAWKKKTPVQKKKAPRRKGAAGSAKGKIARGKLRAAPSDPATRAIREKVRAGHGRGR
ncbi:MAG: hypothetical protein HYY28_13905 [Betaproteobacteria bacterium]|nr:hypothetical protein [Betaproteobacteria bacterium]MBI2961402.1 hypothetical protein [Betaproteobacteria bacterium]